MTTSTDPTLDGETVEQFSTRLFTAVLGAQEIQAVYLGDRLGWYRALAAQGPLSSAELATSTATTERYAREWLEQQAAAGYLIVDDVDAAVERRRFRLPAGPAEVLTDDDSLNYLAPLARFVAGLGKHLDALSNAYCSGGGVSWTQLGEDAREAQGALNRPLLLHQLGSEILPAIPDLDAVLRRGARVADIGCGLGWSSIGIARSYPASTVDGFDIDEPSIVRARRNAADAGVADRTTFTTVDAGHRPTTDHPAGRYDAVFAFECIHDLPDPVAVLSAMRSLTRPHGQVIIMDENVGDRFAGPASEVERMFYGFSLTCCLPDSMSQTPSTATGTVMRASTLADYAYRAGFRRTEVLPVQHDFFRFYRLHH
jgi:2-polyprenyl-3-methyl-5-hydroxy-6-metoxy-1,4-benzoquinol methylase